MSLSTFLLILLCLFGSCIPQCLYPPCPTQDTPELTSSTMEGFTQKQDRLISTMDALVQKIDGISGEITNLQTELHTVQGIVSSKPNQTEIELMLDNKLTVMSTNIGDLETKMETQLQELENMNLSIGTCSTKHQVSTFRDLLATDECERNTHNCSIHATCRDLPIHFKCSCMAGYSGDGVICEDIDECSMENMCHEQASCTNIHGNYTCHCLPGYEGDGYTCNDIDECSVNNICHKQASCNNTRGSFTCHCAPGFKGDGYTTCNDYVCKYPSLEIHSLGCIKYVEEELTWNAAQAKCKTFGGSLLYGFNKQQFITIYEHIYGIYSFNAAWTWVGVRGRKFVKSPSDDVGTGIPWDLWDNENPDYDKIGDDYCGIAYLDRSPDSPYLFMYTCSEDTSFLCLIISN